MIWKGARAELQAIVDRLRDHPYRPGRVDRFAAIYDLNVVGLLLPPEFEPGKRRARNGIDGLPARLDHEGFNGLGNLVNDHIREAGW